jgi:hypothetical protein
MLSVDFYVYRYFQNRIGGVIVSVLASSAVDRGFEPRSDQTKDYKIVIVVSPPSMQHLGKREKTGWFGIMIMCPSRAPCLSADYCFS